MHDRDLALELWARHGMTQPEQMAQGKGRKARIQILYLAQGSGDRMLSLRTFCSTCVDLGRNNGEIEIVHSMAAWIVVPESSVAATVLGSAAEIIVGSVCSLISGPGDRFLTGRKQQERGLPKLNPCQASGVELAGVAAHIKVGQAHGVMSRQVIVI
jgi:hypothetical protein